ncbi:uncharacterized protein LOC144094357 isoform X2 [Amblyomma americanum]
MPPNDIMSVRGGSVPANNCNGSKLFSVVHFQDQEEVSVVPSSWIIAENTVAWPPHKNSRRINEAVQSNEKPSDHWKKYRCRVLWACDNYDLARKKELQATLTSDLGSEPENVRQKRKRRPVQRLISSDESDSEGNTYDVPFADLPHPSPIFVPQPPPPKIAKSKEHALSPLAATASSIRRSPATILQQPTEDSQAPQQGKSHRNSLQLKTIRMLKEMKVLMNEQLKILKNLQNTIMLHLQPSTAAAEPVDSTVLDLLPLSTHSSLEQLEQHLCVAKKRSDLVAHLSLIGGSSLKDGLRQVMKKCICDSLARDFSLTGRKGKRSFIGLQLLLVVTETLRSSFPKATDCQIQMCVAEWLRYAPSRCKKREIARLVRAEADMEPVE